MQILVSTDGVMREFGARIRRAGDAAPALMAQGLNDGGMILRQRTIAAETAQTGLGKGTIGRAQREHRASSATLAYEIAAEGGNVRLRYFRARETRAGVSASPWNKRRVYGGHFIKGGRFPNRVDIGKGGHVFARAGKARLPLTGGRSGLYIPTEMTTGETAAAFQGGQGEVLGIVMRAVGRAFGA